MDPNSLFIVTGASMGIGRVVAGELAARGRPVLGVARNMAEPPNGVAPLEADVTSSEGRAAVGERAQSYDRIAGLVHCAASLVAVEPYVELDPDELTDHFAVHVAAPIALHNALAARLPVDRMVYLDSYSATALRPGWSAYSIVKAGAQMAARAAAYELPNTRTVRVFPGAVATRVVDTIIGSDSEAAATYAAMRDRGEVADPRDTANFVADILIAATDADLDAQSVWDFNKQEDRDRVAGLAAG